MIGRHERSCHESFMTGEITDRVVELLEQFCDLHAEVSVASLSELPQPA